MRRTSPGISDEIPTSSRPPSLATPLVYWLRGHRRRSPRASGCVVGPEIRRPGRGLPVWERGPWRRRASERRRHRASLRRNGATGSAARTPGCSRGRARSTARAAGRSDRPRPSTSGPRTSGVAGRDPRRGARSGGPSALRDRRPTGVSRPGAYPAQVPSDSENLAPTASPSLFSDRPV